MGVWGIEPDRDAICVASCKEIDEMDGTIPYTSSGQDLGEASLEDVGWISDDYRKAG
jgi:hypothetical protein